MKYTNINKILKLWRDTQHFGEKYINKSNMSIGEELHNQIIELIDKYSLNNAVVEQNERNKLCITSVKFLGTNGKECSIKSSLLEMYHILDDLDKDAAIEHSLVVDVNIDNLDDVYCFAITIILK